MHCGNCGRELRPGARFCPYCRQPVRTSSAKKGDQTVTTGNRDRRGRISRPVMVAIIVGAVVVVAAIGVTAALLATRGHDTRAAQLNTTISTTTPTSLSGTATTVTSIVPTTTSAPVSPTTTTAVGPDYLTLSHALAATLQQVDATMATVGATINSTLPQMPQAAHDELQSMLTNVSTALGALDGATVPTDQAGADGYLRQAAAAMTRRVQATMSGIEGMWTTGSKSGAGDYFNQGRTERDNYRSLLASYQQSAGNAATPAAEWSKSALTLSDLRTMLAKGMTNKRVIYLPDRLPSGWTIAAPGQDYGDVAGGYFKTQDNPWIYNDPPEYGKPYSGYEVYFTDGQGLVSLYVGIGDSPEGMETVTVSGKTFSVWEDNAMVHAVLPSSLSLEGEDVCVDGVRSSKQATLELAAAIKEW